MIQCSRCENFGRLARGWVAPPLAHTRGTLRRLLWESGLPFGDLVDGY